MPSEGRKQPLRAVARMSPGAHQPPGRADRLERIAVAAYYNAEHRGFAAGGDVDDWLEAERQIDRSLPGGQSNPSAMSSLPDAARSEREAILGRERPSPLDAGMPDEPDYPGLTNAKGRAAGPERRSRRRAA